MLHTSLQSRNIAIPLTDHIHRCLLNHHALNPTWFFHYQGLGNPGVELQNGQDGEVWSYRTVLAGDGDRGEYAGFVLE
jgi:hypothetical protein